MNRTPEKTVTRWLQAMHINVSQALIDRQLKTHPDYPSLLSITDTLDYLGIQNVAVQVDKSLLHEVTTPFLAHLTTNDGEFVIAENRDNLENQYPGFFNNWSGVVVMAEKNPGWKINENDEFLKEDRQNKLKQKITLIAILLATFLAALMSKGWITPSLIMLALSGLFVSWLIVSKDLGIESSIAEQVCGNEAGCESVIKSKGAKLPIGIGWSDIGIIWFGTLLLVLLISSVEMKNSGVLMLLSVLGIAAIPFTVYSIYYQWKVIKNWCRLCLIVVGLLYLQLLILSPFAVSGKFSGINLTDIMTFIFMAIPVVIAWFTFKDFYNKKNKWKKAAYRGVRFMRNETVLGALLQNGSKIDTTPWEYDLQLGNSDAQIQIMVACNPFCQPCALAHEQLNDLLDKYNDILGLTIRFAIDASDKENQKTKAVEYMLQHFSEATEGMPEIEKPLYARQMLHAWFEFMDFDKFASLYNNTGYKDVNMILEMHDCWSLESKIKGTPTVFINSIKLPEAYLISDINMLVTALPGIIKNEKEWIELDSILS